MSAYLQAWCFSSKADANDCAAAIKAWGIDAIVIEETNPDAGEGFDVRVSNHPRVAEAQAFAVGFAAARNAGTEMRENPIPREQAIAAARLLVLEIVSNPGTLPGGAVSADDAATLARYVLGLTSEGAAADILGAVLSTR